MKEKLQDMKPEKIYVMRRDPNKFKTLKSLLSATLGYFSVVAFMFGMFSFSRPDIIEAALLNKLASGALLFGVGVAVVSFTAGITLLGGRTFEKVTASETRIKLASSMSTFGRVLMRVATGVDFSDSEDVEPKKEKSEIKSDSFCYGAVSDGSPFEAYSSNILKSLSAYATSSEITATKLLDKGVAFMAGGLVFYVVAIIVWQVFANLLKPDEHVMYVGMAACSMTFIVVEFLAAWFFKQYRYYVEVSLSCLRVRSVYDRYLLGYYALREFDSVDAENARNHMAEILKEDVKWPTYKGGAANDFNFMVESMGAAHASIEKMKGIFQPQKNGKTETERA